MNCVRRHLSAIKGGRLAAACHPARVLTLLISDVPGDDPIDIASGPTVADPTTCADALDIVAPLRHRAAGGGARGARQRARRIGQARRSAAGARVDPHRSPRRSRRCEAAAAVAREAGVTPHILGDALEGEARDVGRCSAASRCTARATASPSRRRACCCPAARPPSPCAATAVAGATSNSCCRWAWRWTAQPRVHALAGDTDGVDGQEEIAGALLAPDTLARAWALGLKPQRRAGRQRRPRLLRRARRLRWSPAPTLTNVNDFRAILIDAPPAVSG